LFRFKGPVPVFFTSIWGCGLLVESLVTPDRKYTVKDPVPVATGVFDVARVGVDVGGTGVRVKVGVIVLVKVGDGGTAVAVLVAVIVLVAVAVDVRVKVAVGGTGVSVPIGVSVDGGGTAVSVLVAVGVKLGGTGVWVAVTVEVKLDVAVADGGTGVLVRVAEAVDEAVDVGVAVLVDDGVGDAVGVIEAVAVFVTVVVALAVAVRVGVSAAGWGISCNASTIALVSVLLVPRNWTVTAPALGAMLLITSFKALFAPTWAKTSRFAKTVTPLMATLNTRSPTASSPE
jgi:hypothetical protein